MKVEDYMVEKESVDVSINEAKMVTTEALSSFANKYKHRSKMPLIDRPKPRGIEMKGSIQAWNTKYSELAKAFNEAIKKFNKHKDNMASGRIRDAEVSGAKTTLVKLNREVEKIKKQTEQHQKFGRKLETKKIVTKIKDYQTIKQMQRKARTAKFEKEKEATSKELSAKMKEKKTATSVAKKKVKKIAKKLGKEAGEAEKIVSKSKQVKKTRLEKKAKSQKSFEKTTMKTVRLAAKMKAEKKAKSQKSFEKTTMKTVRLAAKMKAEKKAKEAKRNIKARYVAKRQKKVKAVKGKASAWKGQVKDYLAQFKTG